MILIVRDGCDFCEPFKDMPGLTIARVVGGDWMGTYVEIGGDRIPCPVHIQGLPTLVDNGDIYIGREPVKARLEQLRGTL
jgi:hypothetical protein